MATAHELPDLPLLPPLTLSTQPMEFPSHDNQAGDVPHFLKSPAMSFAESFRTAYTSQTPGEEFEDFTRADISSFSLTPDLQNSFSNGLPVLGSYNDSAPISSSNGVVAPSMDLGAASESMADSNEPTWTSRHRGESFSSLVTTQDLERDEDGAVSQVAGERFRHQSLPSQEAPIPLVRAGDLPLPSRTPIGPAPTNTPSQSDQLMSSSSLQSIPTEGNTYNAPGRARSESLGFTTPNFSKRTVINTYPQVSVRSSIGNDAFVLAVIGTPRCGKSTVIRKGLSGHGLVEINGSVDNQSSSGPRYIRRTGRIDLEKSAAGKTSHVLEVIEIEAQTTTGGLLKWPQGLPPIDGVIICYDTSDELSYRPVEGLLKVYRTMILPVIVLGCKSDLPPAIQPGDAQAMLKTHDTGLIEVTSATPVGKEKMKKSFQYLLKAVCRQRGPNRIIDNRNPASEQLLSLGTPDGDSWTHTPIVTASTPSFIKEISVAAIATSPLSESSDVTLINDPIPIAINPSFAPIPLSPMNDINHLAPHIHPVPTNPEEPSNHINNHAVSQQDDDASGAPSELPMKPKAPLPRPSQWADLEALLDKLLFLAVSGDDPTYAKHFLLTHRRFATPRSVLLAMQKRMRLLDSPSGDPMFAVFAQMRICNLLETWIREFPHDFAVKGTAGALIALVKSIISKTHLLHYGSEFLPFLEQLPSLVDRDTDWALKSDVSDADSEVYSPEDDDDEVHRPEVKEEPDKSDRHVVPLPSTRNAALPPSRERKSSLPLPRALLSPSSQTTEQNPKQHLRDLVKLSQDVMNVDSEEIGQEITRLGERMFLKIKPRDWLQYTFVSGRCQSIIDINTFSNDLADWVVSLILCHERPKHRSKMIEKFIEIGQTLRRVNNYSALRAFVAGINMSMDEATLVQLKKTNNDFHKNLQSWDLLMQQIRSHRLYRLALRNTKGSCIPALEVHLSDLIRAHEGNSDKNEDFPTKIPWGKYNLMGRFIVNTIQCQMQCRNSNQYEFPERPRIAKLFDRSLHKFMSVELAQSRLKASENNQDDPPPPQPNNPPEGVTGLRRILLW